MNDSNNKNGPAGDDSTTDELINDVDSPFSVLPTQIGSYRILAKLGEGGFGVVYEAQEEHPVRRRVALKVIKPGMDSNKVIARFEAERQALALMTHTNIAKVLGGGLTDRGLPYFVMDLVKGEPITEFCDRNKMQLDERLKLLIPVCHAVQHAHTKAVIHRDIKPSNILVGYNSEGHPTPTVIDFGVSKALNQQLTEKTIYTQEGQMIGTPEYMSPEQAEMTGVDIDTRTDVYSLGVILYELLTGMLPFEPAELRSKMFGELQRLIRDQIPPRPSNRLSAALSTMNMRDSAVDAAKKRHLSESELPKHLRGELDWVVMKCLEKDRERRYETPAALAEELQHFLKNEPVEARPPSVGYRFNKFVRRNKLSAASALLFLVILLTATVVSSRFAVIADKERDKSIESLALRDQALLEAEKRAEQLQNVSAFQSRQYGAIDIERMGSQLLELIVSNAPAQDRDDLRSRLKPINFTSVALGNLETNIFKPTIDAIDSQFSDQPLIRAQLLLALGNNLRWAGFVDLATYPMNTAMDLRRTELGNRHPDTLHAISDFGGLLRFQGKLTEAQRYYQEALDGRREVLGDDDYKTVVSVSTLGIILGNQGKYREAEPYLLEVLESSKRLNNNNEDTERVILANANIGYLRIKQGNGVEAERIFRDVHTRYSRVMGDSYSRTFSALSAVADGLVLQGKFEEAEDYARQGVAGVRRILGDKHQDTLGAIFTLGKVLHKQGNLDEADAALTEALAGRRRVLGYDHPKTLYTTKSLADLRVSQGRYGDAEPLYQEAIDGMTRALNDTHPSNIELTHDYALFCIYIQNFDKAKAFTEQYDRMLQQTQYDFRFSPQSSSRLFGALYTAWHESDPTAGYDIQAAQWQEKLNASNRTDESMTTPP